MTTAPTTTSEAMPVELELEPDIESEPEPDAHSDSGPAPGSDAASLPSSGLDAAPAPDVQRAVDATAVALRKLVREVAGVRGALVATLDGRPVAAELPDHDAGATAAIVAASLGLGSRLADLAGEGALQEIVVRSGSGYVVIYAIGDRGVLTVLTVSAANLALLHLQARHTCVELLELLGGAASPRP